MANELDIKTQQAIENISTLEKNVLSLLDSLEMVEKQAKDVNNSFKSGNLADYNKAQKDSVELQTKLAKKLLEVEKLRTQEQRTLNVLARTQATNNRERDRAIDRSNRLAKSTANQTKRNQEANREFKKLQAELLRATKAYQDMAVKEGFASKNTQRLLADVKRLRAEVDKIQKPIGNFQTNVGNYGSALKGVASAGLAAAGIVGVVDTVIRIGESAFDTTRKLDAMNNAMMVIFDTSENVAKQNEFLTDISEKYGVELLSLTDSYNKFSAAAKGTNLEGEEAQRIFEVVTKASASLGLSAQDTEGALRALQQMMSKGKVTAEELTQQLNERLPGALKSLATGLGVTESELFKMMEQGQLLSEQTLPKLADGIEQTFNLDKIDRIDTLNSNINRLQNEFTNLVKGVNEGDVTLNDFANATIKTLIILLEEWRITMNDLGNDFSIIFNDIKQILNDLGIEFDETISFFDALRIAIRISMIPLKQLTNIIKILTGAISDLFDESVSLGEMFSNNANNVLNLLFPLRLLSNAFLGLKDNISETKNESLDAVNAMNKAFGLVNELNIKKPTKITRKTDTKKITRSKVEKKERESEKQLKSLIDDAKKIAEINELIEDSAQQVNKEAFKDSLEKLIGEKATEKIFDEAIKNAEEFGISFNKAFSDSLEANKGLIDNAFKDLIKPSKVDIKRTKIVFSEQFERLLPDFKGSESDELLIELGLDLETKSATQQLNEFDTKVKEMVSSESFKNLEGEELELFKENAKKAREELELLLNKEKALLSFRDIIAEGFSDLGLDMVADEFTNFFDRVFDESATFQEKLTAGFAVVGSFASELFSQQSERRIESLDRENQAFQDSTDKKIEAIERQLEAENLSAEEKEALEAQIEVFEQQKEQKEKQTKIRQFKAQQKADAEQALMNGALGATQTIARLGVPFGIAPAGIALAFGALQSALILSKAVPEFEEGGRLNGALHKDGGVPIVAKGTNRKVAEAEGGEWIINRKSSQKYNDILNDINNDVLDDNLLNSMILNRLIAPNINIDNGITEDQIYNAVDRAMSKNTMPTYFNDGKNLYIQSNGKYPKIAKKMHIQKNNSSNRTKYN